MSGRHSSGELIARAKAARGVRDDFEREMRSAQLGDLDRDWFAWANRLSVVLGQVLDILTRPSPPVTMLLGDGSAFLSAEDVLVLAQLARKLGGGQ